ncbi:hypothetical protein PSTG_02525 [Puccinia striiformis f. sp. tritici PST-78]|uniref:Prolyl 4-hydroxylase alpha subunit Fe(2+) 2OG dioxygenase domain-containing protein n=1 Tax=Puccinia striiformis f. sp. tritici PST-78 TaxID=1165861 RepID=A0A0L0VY00_9BASI|nr:hypothetical protein PSTG_02525 [Puccinia striiformis f. sp. tritici PST-78]
MGANIDRGNVYYKAKLKADLNQAFEAIDTPGTFAAWQELPTTPPAGLYVDQVGDISMPLSEEQCRNLIAVAHRAPSGCESGTLIDDRHLGNIWEIGADRMDFLEPAWQGYLLSLSQLVVTMLGADGPIRLQLDKMLIYEKGAMSKPQTDTERTRGMFGTLMICLPSAHKGGEVLAKHNGESVILGNSDATQSFSCWYSDVTHEVLPVQSGYRCVLSYNLATRPGHTRPTAGTAPDLKRLPLKNTLAKWCEDLANDNTRELPSHIYQTVDYKYTKSQARRPSVSLQELNAEDSKRVHTLQRLARDVRFEILLALLEKVEHGPITREYMRKRLRSDYSGSDTMSMASHHDLDKVEETFFGVKSLCALDGTIILSEAMFDPSLCLVGDPFEDLDDSEEEFDESASHRFRRWAFVIVPHQRIGAYLAQGTFLCPEDDDSLESACDNRFRFLDEKEKLQSPGNNDCDSALRYLEQLSSFPLAPMSMLDAMCIHYVSRRSRKLKMVDHLKSALEYCHLTLFQTVAVHHQGRLPLSFFDWAKDWLNKLPAADRIEKYRTWIPLLIEGYPSMAQILSITDKMSNPTGGAAVQDEPPFCLRTWAQGVIRRCITNFHNTTKQPANTDGKLIATAIFDFEAEWAARSALLTSLVERFPQTDATAFLLAVLRQLKTQAVAAHRPAVAAKELYRCLSLRVFNHNRKLSNLMTNTKIKPKASHSWLGDTERYSLETGLEVTPRALVQFFGDVEEMDTEGDYLLEPLLKEILAQSATFSLPDMEALWMPFLYQLVRDLVYRSISLETPIYQELTQQFIRHFIDAKLGPIPQAGNFQVPCSCRDCDHLNKFLRNENQHVMKLAPSKATRQHLVWQLDSARISCTHSTAHDRITFTKTDSETEIRQWKKRQTEIYSDLTQKIEHNHLISLLGAEEANRMRSLAQPVQGAPSLHHQRMRYP